MGTEFRSLRVKVSKISSVDSVPVSRSGVLPSEVCKKDEDSTDSNSIL